MTKLAGLTRPAGKRGRPSKDELALRDKLELDAQEVETNETTQERVARIGERFNVMYKLAQGSIAGTLRSLIVSGAPGTGKSHTIKSLLRQAHERNGIQYVVVSGTITGINLYKLLYKYRQEKQIILMDDCDSVYDDEDGMNVLKAALDTTDDRHISWLSEAVTLKADNIPTEFEYKGSMQFITNKNLNAIITHGRSKLVPHFRALKDRSIYLDLKLHTPKDITAWIGYMTLKHGILRARGLSIPDQQMVVDWVTKHSTDIPELSIRTMLKVADFVKTDPNTWESFARCTILR